MTIKIGVYHKVLSANRLEIQTMLWKNKLYFSAHLCFTLKTLLKSSLRQVKILKSLFDHVSIQIRQAAPNQKWLRNIPLTARAEVFTKTMWKESKEII